MAWNPEHTNPPGGLANYYRNNVDRRAGAFVIVAEDFNSFGQAIVKKLIAEIAELPPSTGAATPTLAAERRTRPPARLIATEAASLIAALWPRLQKWAQSLHGFRRGHGVRGLAHEEGLSRCHGGAGRRPQGRHDDHGRRVRPVRHPGEPDRRDPRFRGEGPDRRLQQCRHRRRGPRPAARDPADQEDDLVLCRREQAVRRSSIWPASSRSNSTRRARWPSASAPAAPASRPSSPRPASARWSPRARKMREFDGETYVMERGIVADLRSSRPGRATREGNLVYRKTARNFNPMMATAGKVTRGRGRAPGRARRDRPRPHPHAGHLRRSGSSTCRNYEKRIEQRTVRKRAA